MAEEITVKREDKKATAKDGPFQKVDEDSSSSDNDDSQPADGATIDAKAKKKAMKQEKRDKRRLKKELKLAFK